MKKSVILFLGAAALAVGLAVQAFGASSSGHDVLEFNTMAPVSGNSEIETTLALPSPCFAPIIFVGPSATTWFAVTGTS